MDIQDDRFLSLPPLGAAIWNELQGGGGPSELAAAISQLTGLDLSAATELAVHQLVCWRDKGLLTDAAGTQRTPNIKRSLSSVCRELSFGDTRAASLSIMRVAELAYTEVCYRRRVKQEGLSLALVTLQHERARRIDDQQMLATMRGYHALRRLFRQGRSAHDCLFRSLALAAVLRRNGIAADLCIGIIDVPFSSHAWVETDNVVLNESLDVRQHYTVIGRF